MKRPARIPGLVGPAESVDTWLAWASRGIDKAIGALARRGKRARGGKRGKKT